MTRTLISRKPETILKAFKTLIRPNLEYASSVWNPVAIKQIQAIERIQHKITRLILGKTIPYETRLRILNLPTLKWRRNYLDLLRVYSILTSEKEHTIRKSLFTLNSEVSNVNLRRHYLTIHGENAHTNVFKN